MSKMRFLCLSSALSAIAIAIVWQAYTLKQQFYPTVVYLTRSNRAMALLYAEALVLMLAFGRLLSKIFFGRLRFAEVEHLRERLWYAVTEGCLIFAVLRDEFGVRFCGLLGLLLFLKCFHWLIDERTDYMERSTAINRLFHLRMLSLFVLLFFADTCMLNVSTKSMIQRGSMMHLVFAFEYAVLLLTLLATFVRYVLHTIDKRYENAWEAKSGYLLYADLILSGLRLCLYGLFIFVMSNMRTLPLFSIRQAYLSVRAFRKALSDIVLSRRAIRNMNTLYASPTLDELRANDATCIICREDMLTTAQLVNNSTHVTSCKKLPCGHVFHVACLRNWFQRQQSCPTCRLDVIRNPQAAPAANAAAAAAGPNGNGNGNANANRNQVPVPPQAAAAAQGLGLGLGQARLPNAVQANGQPADAQPTSSASTSAGVPPFGLPFPLPPGFALSPSQIPLIPPMPFGAMPLPPPVFCVCPPFVPPAPPSNFAGLSDAELRELESNERAGLEARIECIRNIQTLLDAAMLQFSQYTTAVRQNTAATQPTTTPTSSSSSTTTTSKSVSAESSAAFGAQRSQQ